ncbi:UDP-glucose flavonoid 3-O-glucosyltransferase 6-like protein [Drosera capensis]
MTKLELVFVPTPAMGLITPIVEVAKRLVRRDERISITILLFKLPMFDISSYVKSLDANPYFLNKRIEFLQLPEQEKPTGQAPSAGPPDFQQILIQSRPVIKQSVEEHAIGSGTRLAGFVVDLFCSSVMAVADELSIPSYILFASGSSLLGLLCHFQHLRDNQGIDITQWEDQDAEFDIPVYRNPVPYKLLPGRLVGKEGGSLMDQAKRYRGAKAIIINTFEELESHAIGTLSEDPTIPKIYPVGPIVNVDAQMKEGNEAQKDDIIRWLDQQPPASVVFLCFGSMGGFLEDQVIQMAKGLEQSDQRFLWSLRQPASLAKGGKEEPPRDYTDLGNILPEGFLERTAERGKIIGWAPQVAVLSHPAVGGFVSHCGWNSTLESLWFGVPVATWPLYAEQQMNAFQLVKELGIAAQIGMDFQWDHLKGESNVLVHAAVIEKGVRELMNKENGVRSKVQKMSEVGRKATEEGGSSYVWMGHFIEDVFKNIEES